MIRLEKIKYDYKNKRIFRGLDLSIRKGSYVSITGPNGSGKTTLAMLVKGFLSPTSGKVFYEDKDVTGEGLNDRIAYIFSNPENQIVSSLVSEDIAFGPENQGESGCELVAAVSRAVSESNMASLTDALTHQLSGGQQQRVAIAGILAMKVDCIIFDEAVSMVDPAGKREILDTLDRLSRKEGITIIHITHSLEDILKSERVVALQEGSIVFDGPPSGILENLKVTSALGWQRKGPAGFIKCLIEKRLLPCEYSYSPEGVAECLARGYDPES
ncbi:MAG: ATP-binding cassette domain-containing protein [Proteobacteria bacterium]|nr:ATP-binding cassette domain-containing protein [Pseudomonadota bacterium]